MKRESGESLTRPRIGDVRGVLATMGWALALGLLLAGCRAEVTLRNAPPPGDPGAFDPVASFGAVSAFAGSSAKLMGFTARFVRSAGTLDLSASYDPSVRYHFLVPAGAGEARPVGAGGGVSDEALIVLVKEPGYYHYKRSGGGYNIDTRLSHQGMLAIPGDRARKKDLERVIPAPRCALADLWKGLAAAGAQGDEVAVVDYDADGYALSIPDTGFKAHFDVSCQPGKELSSKDRERAAKKAAKKAKRARKKEERARRKEERHRARER
jgi:hypothetical protein